MCHSCKLRDICTESKSIRAIMLKWLDRLIKIYTGLAESEFGPSSKQNRDWIKANGNIKREFQKELSRNS